MRQHEWVLLDRCLPSRSVLLSFRSAAEESASSPLLFWLSFPKGICFTKAPPDGGALAWTQCISKEKHGAGSRILVGFRVVDFALLEHFLNGAIESVIDLRTQEAVAKRSKIKGNFPTAAELETLLNETPNNVPRRKLEDLRIDIGELTLILPTAREEEANTRLSEMQIEDYLGSSARNG
jgi:hypothetical protein